MTNLLYIGNQLTQSGNTQSTIDTLSLLLKGEGYSIVTASKKTHKLWRLLDMLWHIVRFKHQTDYVLIDTYSTQNFYYAYLCSLLCRFFNLKYMPLLHGGHLENRLVNSSKLSRALFLNAYKNVAPSEYLETVFKQYGYRNIVVIPNSIELKNYPFKTRTFEVPKLLWVRAFAKIYNPLLAIKVFKKLKEEGFDAQLCMVGPDKDGTLLKAKAYADELGVSVIFTGKLSKEEWLKLSEDYNIFMNTTNFDNTPISVIEAMALGMPIVSTNVGGLPFLLENTVDGLLVEPDHAVLFAEAIKSIVLSNIDGNIMALNARKKIEQFDWCIVKDKWNNLLT